MGEQAQAQEAIKNLNGKELMGKQISVKEAYAPTGQGKSGRQGERMNYRGNRNRY